jgi:hypothetical protein
MSTEPAWRWCGCAADAAALQAAPYCRIRVSYNFSIFAALNVFI